jgi:fructose-1,6-bisphosphatase/inositol monophosphatase family enzyme
MDFAIDDLRRLGDILARAAKQEILPRFRKLAETDIRQKTSSFDLVTEADEAAEAAITAELLSAFSHATVIGEESTARDPDLLQAIAGAPLAFIVDPIDGTRNFAAGLPLFGVMAAVTVKGTVQAGVIHDPIMRDHAFALRDGGAWIEHEDGTRSELRVAAPQPLERMEGLVGTSFLPEPQRTQVNSRLSRLGITSTLRCAAHEYRMAAGGHCHVLFYNKLMPWDHAAGWLLHREAGGYSAHFDGTPYLPTHFGGGLICAPDAASWQKVRDALLQD